MSYLAKIILSSHKTSAGALTFQSLVVRPEVNRLDKEQKVREKKNKAHLMLHHFCCLKVRPRVTQGQNVHSGTSSVSWRTLGDGGSTGKHCKEQNQAKHWLPLQREIHRLKILLKFLQNGVDRFGFVSSSPEVDVSMCSCH